MRPRDPLLTGLVLGFYVLPATAATVVLYVSGLRQLALALLVTEIVTSVAVLLARRHASTDKDPDDRPVLRR